MDEVLAAQAAAIAAGLVDESTGAIKIERFIEWFTCYEPFATGKKRKRTSKDEISNGKTSKKAKDNKKKSDKSRTVLTKQRRNALLKALKSSLKKGIRIKKFYEYGCRNECASEVMMTPHEFNTLFGEIGERTGNPNSKTVIKKNITTEEVTAIFGDILSGIKTQTYSRPRFMCKQRKTGSQPVTIGNATISYSANTNKCKMKFLVSNSGPSHGHGVSAIALASTGANDIPSVPVTMPEGTFSTMW